MIKYIEAGTGLLLAIMMDMMMAMYDKILNAFIFNFSPKILGVMHHILQKFHSIKK